MERNRTRFKDTSAAARKTYVNALELAYALFSMSTYLLFKITKKKKALLVEVTAHSSLGPIDPTNIKIELYDLEKGINIEPGDSERSPWMHFSKKAKPRSTEQTHYFPVKIFMVRTYLQFKASLRHGSELVSGLSGSIYVTNTGASSYNRGQVSPPQIAPIATPLAPDPRPASPDSPPPSLYPTLPAPQEEEKHYYVPANLNVGGLVQARGCILMTKDFIDTLHFICWVPLTLLYYRRWTIRYTFERTY